MDELKQAFFKVKQDIFSLGSEIQSLKLAMADLNIELRLISSFMNDVKEKILLDKMENEQIKQELQNLKLKITEKSLENSPIHEKPPVLSVGMIPTDVVSSSTIQHINPTHPEIPTDKLLSQLLKSQKIAVSSGNEGVPTDRQTNQQTNRHIVKRENPTDNQSETLQKPSFVVPNSALEESRIDHIEKAAEILDSLDALKKEIRRKFKALTSQEISVFSLLYQLEEQGIIVDYPILSSKLGLSESSIRDYILKIQRKGIPITKEKLNNKRVILHISLDLKKIASLDTILKLREI